MGPEMSRRKTLNGTFGGAIEELATANLEKDEGEAMHEALLSGLRVQDIAPRLIDDSFVRDRIGDLALSEDEPFVQPVANGGQEVAILVRPHPEREGRYHVAYGHRRLTAARILGIPVKAVVKQIADEELVVAQGVGDTARRNLTYMEQATFARILEERGFRRAVIMKALTTDKTELSKMISVASSTPVSVTAQIGNTPARGRRKWIAFAEAYSKKNLSKLESLFASELFSAADSDKRFDLALELLVGKVAKPNAGTWAPREGQALTGSIKTDGRTYKVTFKIYEATAFGVFLTDKPDELYAEFKRIED
ncbi:plasmid partitioning protein RepB [Sinorhizobium medicae]|nr:plasmid partitioning protein RepB [Sinorhizobium medicae]MDX1244547.1 plasmid partitioning protein RepB [Sinorhizobium medicae]